MVNVSLWKRITALVIVVFVVLLFLYDITEYAFWGGNPGTISVVLFGAETRHPLLVCEFCFAIGVFVGHVFLYQTAVAPTPAEQKVLAVVAIPANVITAQSTSALSGLLTVNPADATDSKAKLVSKAEMRDLQHLPPSVTKNSS